MAERILGNTSVTTSGKSKCAAAGFSCTNHGAQFASVHSIYVAGELAGHTRIFVTRLSVDVSAPGFDAYDWRNYVEVGAADKLGKKVKTPVALSLHTSVPLRRGQSCRFFCHTSHGGSLVVDSADAERDDALAIESAEGGNKLLPADEERQADEPFTL